MLSIPLSRAGQGWICGSAQTDSRGFLRPQVCGCRWTKVIDAKTKLPQMMFHRSPLGKLGPVLLRTNPPRWRYLYTVVFTSHHVCSLDKKLCLFKGTRRRLTSQHDHSKGVREKSTSHFYARLIPCMAFHRRALYQDPTIAHTHTHTHSSVSGSAADQFGARRCLLPIMICHPR